MKCHVDFDRRNWTFGIVFADPTVRSFLGGYLAIAFGPLVLYINK